MEQNPYTPTALPKAADYLKEIGGSELGDNSNNEASNPYVGNPPADSPPASMGPRFQALADGAGMGGAAHTLAPALTDAASSIAPAAVGAASAIAGAVEKPSFQRMQNYLNQYRMQGKKDFSKDDAPQNIDDMMARVAMRESMGDSKAHNPNSTASGLFQYIKPTWAGHGGFEHAADAPPEMQYNRMLADLAGSLKRNNGDVPRSLLDHYGGPADTQKVLKNPKLLYEAPGQHNGAETRFKRIASLIGADKASQWATDHHSKLADAKSSLESVYGGDTAGQG